MDTTILYFIILMVAILVIITIGMYRQLRSYGRWFRQATAYIGDMERLNDSNDKQIAQLEKELKDEMKIGDRLLERFDLSQTAREIQAEQIKELQDEICKLEYKLQDSLVMALN